MVCRIHAWKEDGLFLCCFCLMLFPPSGTALLVSPAMRSMRLSNKVGALFLLRALPIVDLPLLVWLLLLLLLLQLQSGGQQLQVNQSEGRRVERGGEGCTWRRGFLAGGGSKAPSTARARASLRRRAATR